jgi:hypothetical protein
MVDTEDILKQIFTKLDPYIEDGANIMLVFFLCVSVLIIFLLGMMSILHEFPLDYGEAPLLDQAIRLSNGENIYRSDISTPPFTISNYPPLYILALAPFVKLFGPSFLAGRLISLLCTFASAYFIALIIYFTHDKDRLAAFASGTLFLTFPFVVQWSALHRVDMFALALSTAALYILVRFPAKRTAIVGSAVLLVGAIFTRQSYGLAAPFAAFVWLWSIEKRKAIQLAGIVAGISILLFLLLNTLTSGGFYYNIVSANVNIFKFETVKRTAEDIVEMAPVLLVFGFTFLIFAFRRIKSWALIGPYLVGSTLSAMTIGKIGSNVNYLMEFSAGISLASGAFIAWSVDWAAKRNRNLGSNKNQKEEGTDSKPEKSPRFFRSVILVLLSLQVGWLIHDSLTGPVEGRKWSIQPEADHYQLSHAVEFSDDPILADEFMGILTLQGRPLYLQPFEVTQLSQAGLWDQTPLLESISNREFPLIMIHHFRLWPVYQERWTTEMLGAIKENYQADDFYAETIIFRPRVDDDIRPEEGTCPDAPWRLPSQGDFGLFWFSRQVVFLGDGDEGELPVSAVADGLLTRFPEWKGAVAIQHQDPFNPDNLVWSFYGDMVDTRDGMSLINPEFPPGTESVPVKKGELLGYQGRWLGEETRIWVHTNFAVVSPMEDGSFPVVFNVLEHHQDPLPTTKELNKLELLGLINPAPYLGIEGSKYMGSPVWIPLNCVDVSP